MITKPEFELLLKRLMDEYDPENKATGLRRFNSYGPGRIAAIWECFKNSSKPEFEAIMRRAFETERHAPMLRDLLRIQSDLQEEARLQKHEAVKRGALGRDRYDNGVGPEKAAGHIQKLVSILRPRQDREGA